MKKEYAILSVVIISLGLYLFFRNSDRTTYTLPELPAVDTQALTKIETEKGDQTVVLTRKEEEWFVSPGNYPADINLVKGMLDVLAQLKVTALVSETKNYSRYELDKGQQIQVTAYQDDKAQRTFNIGKAAATMRHTHITLADDPNVYHAQGNFRHDFDQSVESLRDKSILAFKSDDIADFSIETGDRKVALKKITPPPAPEDDDKAAASTTGPEKTPAVKWVTPEGQDVADNAVKQLLSALSRLKCRAYLTDQVKTDFTDPTYRIRLNGPDESMLEIFAPADDTDTEIPARSSLRNDPFTLSDFDLDPIKDFLAGLDNTEDKASP